MKQLIAPGLAREPSDRGLMRLNSSADWFLIGHQTNILLRLVGVPNFAVPSNGTLLRRIARLP
jgi:hypothetical protein